jgi:hypothetical protein
MPCKNCDDCKWNINAICRCCEIVDGNTTIKRVCWCSQCRAYLCKDCIGNYPKRAIAFVENLAQKAGDAVADLVQTISDKAEEILKPKKKKKDFPTDDFGKEDQEGVSGTA